MGYDYFIQITVSDPDSLGTWSPEELTTYTSKLRQAYTELSKRNTFPEINVKTRGYFSTSDTFYFRDDSTKAPIRLVDELQLLTNAVPNLKLDVLYLYFDLTEATLYELYQGTVTEVESKNIPSMQLGGRCYNLAYDINSEEDEYDIKHIINDSYTLHDYAPKLSINIPPKIVNPNLSHNIVPGIVLVDPSKTTNNIVIPTIPC